MNANRLSRVAMATAAVAGLTTACRAQAIWTGGAGNGDWHTALNWSTGVVPSPETSVTIPAGFPGVSASGVFVSALTAQSPLSVGAGGTAVSQNATLKDFTTTGGFICNGSVSFSGAVEVTTFSLWRAAGGFQNTGTMNVTGLPLNQTTLTNQGVVNVSNGPLTIGGAGSRLINNGTLELRSGGRLLSGGRLDNNAAWRKVGMAESEVQCEVHHTGSLEVRDGLLRLGGGGTYSAPMTIGVGAKIRLEGPSVFLAHYFDAGSEVSGEGEMEIQGAGSGAVQILEDTTFNLQGEDGLRLQGGGVSIQNGKRLLSIGKLRWEGGAFEGPGMLENRGGLVIPAGSSAPANNGVTILNNFATVDLAGVLNLNDGSVYDNLGLTTLRGEIRAATPASAAMRNLGFITSDPGPGGTARIQPRLIHQGGPIEAISGTLIMQGGGSIGPGGAIRAAVRASNPGTLVAFDAGTYEVIGANSELDAGSGAAVRIRGAGTVVDVLPGSALYIGGDGQIFLEFNAQMGGSGAINNIGSFAWNSRLGVNGQANFVNHANRQASGSVVIPSGASLRGLFKNSFAANVVQRGPLDMAAGTVDNNGNWVIQPPTTALIGITGVGGFFQNGDTSTISAEALAGAGRSAQISTTLSNLGSVQAIGGITLTINGQLVQLQNGHLSGGSWRTAEGGRLILPSAPPIIALSNVDIVGSQQGMPWLAGVQHISGARLVADGNVVFTAPLHVEEDEQGTPSVVRIGPGATLTVPVETTVGAPEQTSISYVEASLTLALLPTPHLITPTLTLHGGLRPGGADQAGVFNLSGDLAMQDSGVVEIELRGTEPEEEHDRLAITGGASLRGTLEVRLLPGFVPEVGQTFTVLTTTAPISGVFTQIRQPPGLPGMVRFEAAYTPTAVTLTAVAGCYANCDGSTAPPILNVNDFICFQQHFAAGDPHANCDGSTASPTLNINDFICFQAAFAAGCP